MGHTEEQIREQMLRVVRVLVACRMGRILELAKDAADPA